MNLDYLLYKPSEIPHAQSSHVYDCFEFDDKYKTYKCIEKKKSGEECGNIIKVGMWNPCSNLKRHLERFHAEKSKKVKQADEQDLKSKQKKLELNNQPLIASHFQPQSVTVAMNKDKFI